MYLKNQKNRKFNDKKPLKPLKTTYYSKIKNRQRKTKSKDLLGQDQLTVRSNILPKEKTNEIEKYFLKRVGDVTRTNLNLDSNKPSTSEESSKNTSDKTKIKKSEFDLINQYLDCSRITAFNNYLSNKDLPKFNLSKKENDMKSLNISKEFSLTDSPFKSEEKVEEKFSIDYLAKEFREPFEKNKFIYMKRAEIIRKELMEVYQLNFLESPQSKEETKKNLVDCEIQTTIVYQTDQIDNHIKNPASPRKINIGSSSSAPKSLDSFIPSALIKQDSNSATETNQPFKTKIEFKDLKLEDLYYD